MASTYASFRQSPAATHLASDASLNYITTTTSLASPDAIVKHLLAQEKQVIKKAEKVLNVIESSDSLCLEIETTLLFKSGGGTYLPGVDENLLDERTVTFPLLHIVRFDNEGKIKQVRLYWDQGTLLKQVEAIGRSGRNWPIRDGQAQIEAIAKSVRQSGPSAAPSSAPLRGNTSEVVVGQSKGGARDPHASLALFERRDPNEDPQSGYDGPKHATRSSAKPAPRDYGDLFAGEESAKRSESPMKAEGFVLKHGAGKNFSKNRLFDENEPTSEPKSPERKKTYGQKYEHFAFGDGEDAPDRPTSGKSGKSSQSKAPAPFSFEDFATPPKHTQKDRPSDERHWGTGVEEDDPPSPPIRPIVHAARPDAVSHFQLTDESPAHPTGGQRKAATATNVDASRQNEKFDAHYDLTDKSPNPTTAKRPAGKGKSDLDQHWSWGAATDTKPIEEKKIYKTAGNGMGGRATQNATRHFLEETPPAKEKKIYKTAGDGMGGRNGGNRLWGIGNESDPEVEDDVRPSARTRRPQASAGREDDY